MSPRKAKIPEQKPKTFTVEELAEYSGWSVLKVRRHIRDGDLKRILVTADRPDLSNWRIYRCDEDTCLRWIYPPELEEDKPRGELLLQRIYDGMPLEHFVDPVISENILHCLEYEYLYIPGGKAIEKPRNRNNISVRYFYDLEGNILIPICDWVPGHEDEDCVSFVSIEKHAYDSPLVSFEAVERLESENKTTKSKGNPAKRQDHILKIVLAKYDLDNLVYNPSVKDVKDEVRQIFHKTYKEEGLTDKTKREKAFVNAWGNTFKVDEKTGKYVKK